MRGSSKIGSSNPYCGMSRTTQYCKKELTEGATNSFTMLTTSCSLPREKMKRKQWHAAEKGTNFLVKKIKKTSLQVALDKTEVVIFEGANDERKSQLNIEGKVILLRSFIRHPWRFCR